MHQLIQSFIVSSIIFLIDAYSKQKKSFTYYLTIFFLVAGMGFLFASETENDFRNQQMEKLIEPPNAKKEIQSILIRMSLCRKHSYTKKDKKYYQEKEKFHQKEGKKCFFNAKNKIWYLPDLDDREKARYCFTSAITSALPADPRAKVIGVILQLVLQYGLDCMDEYNYIQNQLQWSQYHFEMNDFYSSVLKTHF